MAEFGKGIILEMGEDFKWKKMDNSKKMHKIKRGRGMVIPLTYKQAKGICH